MEVAARLRAADVAPAEAVGGGGASPPMPGAPEARSSTYLGISPLVCQRRASLGAGPMVWRECGRVRSEAGVKLE